MMLKFFKSPWIPGVLAAGVATTMALNSLGVISLPHLSLPNLNIIESPKESVYTFPSTATVGKYLKYDFSTELINDLEPQGRQTPEIYSFYLGSGVGFPPMGLTLDPLTGILSGTPKERLTVAADSKFEVCVKDVGGKSACRTYVLPVAPKATATPKPKTAPVVMPKTAPASTQTTSCPANSHLSSSDSSKCTCDTGYQPNSAGNGCAKSICPANSHQNPSDLTQCPCDTGYQTNSAGTGCEPKTEQCPTTAEEIGCGTETPDGFGFGGMMKISGTWLYAPCACPPGTTYDSEFGQVADGRKASFCNCNQ